MEQVNNNLQKLRRLKTIKGKASKLWDYYKEDANLEDSPIKSPKVNQEPDDEIHNKEIEIEVRKDSHHTTQPSEDRKSVV